MFSSEVLQGFLKKLYEGFDTSDAIEPTAWREVLRIMNEASIEGLLESGYPTHEQTFLSRLRHSNEVFSAFKVHSMATQMQSRLYDSEGKLRSFKAWREAVAPIASHQVGSWLRTEYDTAVLRAHQASDWQEFERNRDILPNLRWMPTTSPTPDTLHEGFWSSGLTLPIDDPFWEEHHPANRWNCKCSLEATDDPTAGNVSEYEDKPTAQRGLEENPRHGHTFSDKHPYFPKDCKACPYYKAPKGTLNRLLDFLNKQDKDCYNCPHINQKIDEAKEQIPPEIETYRSEHKGKVLVSPYHGADELAENLRVAKFLADKIKGKVHLLPRLDPRSHTDAPLRNKLLPKGVKEGKSPDFYIRGKLFDCKSMLEVERGKSNKLQIRSIENRYRKAKEQADNIVIEIPTHIKRRNINKAIWGQLHRSSKERVVYVKHGRKLVTYKKQRGN